jgi:signal transduction histidine kinase/tetratricopeptide (TPR) repeat protein
MKNTLLFLFLLISSISYSQKKEGQALIDSLLVELPKMKDDTLKVNLLNDIAFNYAKIYPNKGIKFAREALSLSKNLNWKSGIAASFQCIGENLSIDSDYKNSLLYFDTALKLATNKKRISQIFGGIGTVYYYLNNYPTALEYDNKSLKIREEINDIKGQGAVLSNIGIIYLDLKDYKQAIMYLEKALVINEKTGVKSNQIRNLGNLGTCYTKLNENEKAIDFYLRAIKLSDEIGQKNSKVINLFSIGLTYFNLKDNDKSLEFSNESLKLSREIGNKMGLIKNFGLIGNIYFEKSKSVTLKNDKKELLIKAVYNLTESINFSKTLGEISEAASNYKLLAEIQKLQGNFKDALDYYELSVIYKDSIFNSENRESIKNIEDKRAIELRDKEIQIYKLSLQVKERQKWFLITGLALLGIIGALFFYQSRNRKKNNYKLQLLNSELDQANKAKAQYFSILTHDLRGPVSNLVLFLHLQKESPEMLTEESIKRMQEKTIRGAENLLASMEDILQWSKSQMGTFKPQPKNVALSTLFEDIKTHFLSEEKVNISFLNPDNLIIYTDENYLKTIIRNLTGNAIKASDYLRVNLPDDKPVIIWKAWQENKHIFLSISDNSRGAISENFKALYSDKEVGGINSGLGLHLIRDLAKAIDCTISVDSKIGVGTTILLVLNKNTVKS